MGKGANFNWGDKHCVITPKNGLQFFSIDFSIPESIPSHTTDFIVDVISTKLKLTSFLNSLENPYCSTEQNDPYGHTTITIVENTLKFLAHVADSRWFNRNFSQIFSYA